MQKSSWYNIEVPKSLEKKNENFSLKMPVSLMAALATIAELEDRPLGYVGRELMVRGLARIVYVRRAVTSGLKGGGFQIKDPKTAESRRAVRISTQLRDRLLRQREIVNDMIAAASRRHAAPLLLDHLRARGTNYSKRQARRRIAAQTLKNHREYNLVFPASNGAPMSRLNLNKRELKEALGKAGLANIAYSLYSLRHSCATLMLAAGVDVRTIAEKLGHSDATQVLKRYSHVLPSMRSDAMEKLSAALY